MPRQQACEVDTAGKCVPESTDGRQGSWVRFAPECRLLIAAVVGPRRLDTAQEVVALTQARVAGLPACFRDSCAGSVSARIAAVHVVTTWTRTGTRCAPPGSRLWATGPTAASREAADAPHTRRPGSRTPDAPWLHDAYSCGRMGAPDLASGLGTVGTQDVQLLHRPRAPAAAGGLFPGLRHRDHTA